jgi:hypothetical protein
MSTGRKVKNRSRQGHEATLAPSLLDCTMSPDTGACLLHEERVVQTMKQVRVFAAACGTLAQVSAVFALPATLCTMSLTCCWLLALG